MRMLQRRTYMINVKETRQIPALIVVIFFCIVLFFSCIKIQREAKVITKGYSGVTATAATVTGEIVDLGNGVVDHGFCWSLSPNPSKINMYMPLGTSLTTGSYASVLPDLSPGQTYYIRTYIETEDGISYGNEIQCTTNGISYYQLEYVSGSNQTFQGGSLPSPLVFRIKNITSNRYVTNLSTEMLSIELTSSSGFQDGDFSNADAFCSNGDNSCFGVYYYVDPNTGPPYTLTINVTLKRNDQILYQVIVKENITGTVGDTDGNTYKTVKIGTQIWMAENLKTTKFNDGGPINMVSAPAEWSNLSTAAYCVYNNDPNSFINTYGLLYNWHAVNNGNLCPVGWHVPDDSEWITLINFLGGIDKASGKLKESGTLHWIYPNTGAVNEYGFTALPGGWRFYSDGSYNWINYGGYWWSSTSETTSNAWNINMAYDYEHIGRDDNDKKYGFSVRCIKDL